MSIAIKRTAILKYCAIYPASTGITTRDTDAAIAMRPCKVP